MTARDYSARLVPEGQGRRPHREGPPTTTKTCAHCGRNCGDHAGGMASVDGQPVCHPNFSDRPDCYHLVTVYHEVLGSRRALPPADLSTVTDELREQAYAVCMQHGIPWNDHAVDLLLAGILSTYRATVREEVAQEIETADGFPYESGCSCREQAAALARAGNPRTAPLIAYVADCRWKADGDTHRAVFHNPVERQRWINDHQWDHPFVGITADEVVEAGPGEAG